MQAKFIPYLIRALGGILFLLGSLIMVYNLIRTVRGDTAREPGMVKLEAAHA